MPLFRREFARGRAAGSRSAGFTLVEIMVVVLLMAMAAGAVAGFGMRRGETVRLKADARKLRSFFQVCRTLAMASGQTVVCQYVPDDAQVVALDHDRKLELDEDTRLGKMPSGKDDQPKVPEEKADVASFYPDGAAVGGVLALLRGERTMYLVLDPLFGNVRTAASLEAALDASPQTEDEGE